MFRFLFARVGSCNDRMAERIFRSLTTLVLKRPSSVRASLKLQQERSSPHHWQRSSLGLLLNAADQGQCFSPTRIAWPHSLRTTIG